MSAVAPTPDATDPDVPDTAAPASAEIRQPIVRVRVRGARVCFPHPARARSRLPGDDAHPGASRRPAASGPNDAQLLRDVPPHY